MLRPLDRHLQLGEEYEPRQGGCQHETLSAACGIWPEEGRMGLCITNLGWQNILIALIFRLAQIRTESKPV